MARGPLPGIAPSASSALSARLTVSIVNLATAGLRAHVLDPRQDARAPRAGMLPGDDNGDSATSAAHGIVCTTSRCSGVNHVRVSPLKP